MSDLPTPGPDSSRMLCRWAMQRMISFACPRVTVSVQELRAMGCILKKWTGPPGRFSLTQPAEHAPLYARFFGARVFFWNGKWTEPGRPREKKEGLRAKRG